MTVMQSLPFTIVPIRPQDTPAVLEVYRKAALSIRHAEYTPDILTELAARSADEFDRLGQTRLRYVAMTGHRIVGYAGLDCDKSVLTECYVAPEYSGQQIGSCLVAHIKEEAAKYGLTSLSVMAALNAVPFYEQHGFAESGELYLSMRDDLRMRCMNMQCVICTA